MLQVASVKVAVGQRHSAHFSFSAPRACRGESGRNRKQASACGAAPRLGGPARGRSRRLCQAFEVIGRFGRSWSRPPRSRGDIRCPPAKFVAESHRFEAMLRAMSVPRLGSCPRPGRGAHGHTIRLCARGDQLLSATNHFGNVCEPAVASQPRFRRMRAARDAFTSAGMSSGLDLALALVEQDYGSRLVRVVALYVVQDQRRHHSQLVLHGA